MENPEGTKETSETTEPEETETGEGENEEVTGPNDGIKIVINLKGTKAVVGVQASGCDPVFGMVEGNRDEIAQGALRILASAEEKWKATPRYPKSEVKPVAAPAATRATPAPARAATTDTKPQSALF